MVSDRHIRIILNTISEAIILVDTNGILSLVNERALSLLGLDPHRLQGQSIIHLMNDALLGLPERMGFAPDDLQQLIYQLQTDDWSASQHEATYQLPPTYEYMIYRRHIPIQDEDGRQTHLLFVFEDRTTTRELQEAQNKTISMIVHDLRSPLAAVKSSMRLLHDMANPEEPMGRMVLQTTGIANRAVKKVLYMVNTLLDVAKMESGLDVLDREPINIFAMIQSIARELDPLAHELGVTIELQHRPNIPLIDADANKIERVIFNLIDNAIKFSPTNGVIRVVAYPQARQGHWVQVDVIDQGSGIPNEYKQKLFDRYEQLDESYARRQGTGLGLTFCKLSIEAHGGHIWIDDNPDGGSIFSFTLPTDETIPH